MCLKAFSVGYEKIVEILNSVLCVLKNIISAFSFVAFGQLSFCPRLLECFSSVQVSLFELLLNLQNYTTTLILLITFPCHILRITHVLLNYIIFRLDANPVNGANVVHLKL